MAATLLRHVASHPSLFLGHSSISSPHSTLDQPKLQNAAKFSTFRAVRTSPFTEKHSSERYQRDAWLYQQPIPQGSCFLPCDSDAIREDDIALQLPELKKLLEELKQRRADAAGGTDRKGPGNVFLVGTGPGDPELLTVKAMNAIKAADLVLYDRLVSNDIMDLVSSDARLLYVGKTAGYHSRTQEEIHELLLSFAEVGANVVRLKGGDPLVFGRGGEEMDFLKRQGIRVKVIPGRACGFVDFNKRNSEHFVSVSVESSLSRKGFIR